MKHLLPKAILFAAIALLVIWLVFSSMNDLTKDGIGTDAVSKDALSSEIATIRTAAERNGIEYGSDDWFMLLAINKAEGNVPGKEFGILVAGVDTLDEQAGWCAASIVKGRKRWTDAGKPEDFIVHFGRRYCPPDAHELNANWVGNVTYWFNKLKGE